jgi:hypothetical protein
MFLSSALLTLVLPAFAGGKNEVSIETIEIAHHGIEVGLVVLTDDNDTTIASMVAEVESEGGTEGVALTESNAFLAGSAALAALPKSDATLNITVYDRANLPLAAFTGTLDSQGAVSLMVPADSCGKAGCEADVELLSALTSPDGAGGTQLSLTLQGADTYAVAYAEIAVTEGKTTTTAEVGWGTVGSVWEGALGAEHSGLLEVRATAYDADGSKLADQKMNLGLPLHDGDRGQNTLASDDDPLTRLALLPTRANFERDLVNGANAAVVVVSEGWPVVGAMPVDAEVELTGGKTLTIPANSYQVTAAAEVSFRGSPEKEAFQVAIDGVTVKSGTDFTERGFCSNGTCIALAQDDSGVWTLSATAYAAKASELPTSVKVSLTSTLKAAVPLDASTTLTYSSQADVIFANAVGFGENPLGIDLAGTVSVLGAATKKGKQDTLSKGKFHGTLGVSLGGNLSLGAADKNDVQPKGDILIGGEPIDFELIDDDGDGTAEAPPVVMLLTAGNGKGTRAVATTNNGTPGLL